MNYVIQLNQISYYMNMKDIDILIRKENQQKWINYITTIYLRII